MNDDSHATSRFNRGIDRRALLRGGAGAAIAIGAASHQLPMAFAAPATAIGKLPATQGTKELIVNIEDDVNTLDPAKGLGTHTLRTIDNMFNSLVETFGDVADPQPSLATEWSVNDEGTEWTFKLREGVTFHDGTPFDAEAVKFSIDRSLFPDHPYYFPPYPFPPFFLASVKEIVVVDPMTVKFVLHGPDPTFIGNLCWTTSAIVSPEAIKTFGKDIENNPVGTGPFKFVTWEKGKRLVMEKNPDYWDGAPAADSLIFKPVPEEAARLTQLQAGELNVAVALSPEFIPEVEGDANLTLLTNKGIHTWYAILNLNVKPLDDVRVRQALNYAIDRQAIVDEILKGAADVSSAFSYPDTWSYEPKAEIYTYDPDKAKALLKEAGQDGGFDLLYLVPESGSGMIAPKAIGTIMQAYLAEIGVNAEIQTMEWVSYLNEFAEANGGMDRTGSGKPPLGIIQMSWMSTIADPGLYINYYLTSTGPFNNGSYKNPKMDELLNGAMQTVDQEERKALYSEAQILAANDAPWIFMFHAHNVAATRNNLSGLVLNPNMNNLKLDKITFNG
ncbi:MAG: ABC transporter substrate-binding protein [Thermomicrobiales bacterium]